MMKKTSKESRLAHEREAAHAGTGAKGNDAAAMKAVAEGPKAPLPDTKAAPQDPAQAEMAKLLKEIEAAMFSVRFHPVAVPEQAKTEALAKLESIYSSGNETVRQMLMYMVHEYLATSADLKTMHTLEYFRMKNAGQDPAQQRMSVYRAIFNYNTSLEGLIELVKFLGRLRGSDDAVKLLTYHYSHLAFIENEASHVLRASILDALGKADSKYALLALIDYAEYTDNERSFGRIVGALLEWEKKLDRVHMPDAEKAAIREKLKKIVTSEFGGSHYG